MELLAGQAFRQVGAHGVKGNAKGGQVVQQGGNSRPKHHEQASHQEQAVKGHCGHKISVNAAQGVVAQQAGADQPLKAGMG
jgi:hypothetical protein